MFTMQDAWLERRFGKFEVAAEYLKDISLQSAAQLFSDMVIYNVESDTDRGSLTYFACSPLFEALPDNTPAQWYNVVCSMEPCDIGGFANRIHFERLTTHAA